MEGAVLVTALIAQAVHLRLLSALMGSDKVRAIKQLQDCGVPGPC